ncbi:unnamed protein product, partial [Prorocentrum cordatum]
APAAAAAGGARAPTAMASGAARRCPLPPEGDAPPGPLVEDFHAALEGALTRLSEAHCREVSELRRRLDGAGRPASPRGPVALAEPPEAAASAAPGAGEAEAAGGGELAAKLREARAS